MPRFDVDVTLKASSVITVEAIDDESARKLVQTLEASAQFDFPPEVVETSGWDGMAEIEIDAVMPAEDEI